MQNRGLFKELFVGNLHRRLPWTRVAVYTAVVMLLVAVTKTSVFNVVAPRISDDDHGMLSLNIAVNRSICGRTSAVSTETSNGKVLFMEPGTSDQPLQQMIAARWGSIERYCMTATRPFTINENSLMLLESWAWRIAPNLSLIGVGRVLLAIKVVLLLFFCVVFLRLGAGAVLCYASVDAGFALLARLQRGSGYATYSFLIGLVMATIALYPLMLSLSSASRARQMAWPAIAGVWSAFVVNMRTSYLPLCAGLALLYVGALAVESHDPVVHAAKRIRRIATAVIFFAVGFAIFQYTFIAQSRGAGDDNLARHTFFHPLVLAVGVPENDFSHREGIEWDDAVGLKLAHRVNPSAVYLTKEYDQALAAYYFDLWKRHPSEMRQVYLEKAKLAATEMMELTDIPDAAVTFARKLLKLLPNGLWLLSLLIGFSVVTVWQYLRRKAPILVLLTMSGAAATMLMLESMLIMPRYFITYHAPLLWLYCTVTFVLVQCALISLARWTPLRANLTD